MKNFTLALLIVAFGFGFSYQAKALKQVKPTSLKSPADFSIAAGYDTEFSFWITNTGDEAILATDSIYTTWGQVVGTQIQLHTPFNYQFRTAGLAVGDSFFMSYTLKVNGTQAGTMRLAFVAGVHLHTLSYIAPLFNLNVGIDEQAKAINKVWFSNNSVNYELMPKTSCKANLNILNMNGQIIENQALNFTAGNSINESISLGTLPKGIYILSIQTPYGVDTKKFVVQ